MQHTTALVTGGSGYLASWVIKTLLAANWTVHTTVRDLSNESKTRHLRAMASEDRLKLFQADLLELGSFREAMQGCDVVLHTASPFKVGTVKDPETHLVKPAVEGTRNVLETANEVESVRRVVLTSSVVAIYSDASDVDDTANGIFTEDDWNTSASLDYQAYAYSKTLAEKKGWEIAGAQDRWDLLTINPSFILGPSLTSRNDSASIAFMMNMGNGTFKTGMPAIELGLVDVRDVAQAHLEAASRPSATGRHILCKETMSMLELAAVLRAHFGKKYPFPRIKTPKWLVWLMGPLFGMNRKYVSRHVGKKMAFDNRYSQQDLGITYRPIQETLIEHFQQLLDDDLVKSR